MGAHHSTGYLRNRKVAGDFHRPYEDSETGSFYHSTCRSETATLRAIFIAPTKLRIFYRFPPGERYRVGQGTYVWEPSQSVTKKEEMRVWRKW